VKLQLEIGKPIPVSKKDVITQEDIDALHILFINEMIRLFDRTKERNGVAHDIKLLIC